MPLAPPGLIDCCAVMTRMVGECRKIGVNYNQVVKKVHTRFDDRTAVKYLLRLEKETVKLQGLIEQAISITETIERYVCQHNQRQ